MFKFLGLSFSRTLVRRVLLLVFLFGGAAMAATVTLATGGNAMASNTAPGCMAAGTWTPLTNPVIAESNAGEIGVGTIILSAPAGFEFNTAASVSVLLAGSGTANRNINGISNGSSVATSVTAAAITFTVSTGSIRVNTLTWQGIQVRPTASAPLAAGNISKAGASVIAGVSDGANLGALTEVASVPICNAAAPSVATNAASALSGAGATLNGTVSSNGASTTVTFDYGLTTAYGSTATASASPLAANATNTAVSAALTGLTCGVAHHFRVKGGNSAGSSLGNDATFVTSACPLPAVVSLNTASSSPVVAGSVVGWNVVFNTSVSAVDMADFLLVSGGGVTGATITTVTGGGTTWTVQANTGTGVGSLALNLVDNDTIVNASNVPLGGVGSSNGSFTGQAYTVVAPAPVLAKVASTSAAVVNDVLTFNISATNPYGVDMTAITVSDVLPTGMGYITHAATLGTLANTGQTVTWSIPALQAGATAQLTLAVKVTVQGALINTVTSPGATSASASVLVLPNAVTHYKMDGTAGSWSGAVGEVIDSGGTALHGTRVTTSTPSATNLLNPTPTIASQNASLVGGFCNAASFDRTAVVKVPHDALFDYTRKLSASAWIYPKAYPPSSGLYTIFSNDVNYEFHITSVGKLNWWWGASQFTSATTIPKDQWTHIAITMDSNSGVARERMYINGVLDANTNNWSGTLASNPCPFYIGGDIDTGSPVGSSCNLRSDRNFSGLIDEVKLYNYELAAAEVQADMTLGRNCVGAYDHIQIEHDGSGSICTPEVVTVKACLNAACTTLYPGDVTVQLSPTGWVGGDTVLIRNGVGAVPLSRSSAGSVSLGIISATPTAISAPRCFSGGTETCTMNFATASCLFDAVEPAANPKTRLLTKLAGSDFLVDVLALSGSNVNTSYTGTVKADLVDTSTSSCSTGTGLTAVQTLSFAAGDAGRKSNVVFNYATPMTDVRVRMQVGSATPACSTDNFAIRPSSVSLLTSPAMATPPFATASATIKAGSSFTLNATATAGYTGTLVLDKTKLTAQDTTQDATIASGGVVGALAPTTLTVNASPVSTSNASYDEVGYVYLAAGAYRDEVFTAVDQPTGCALTSTCDCVTDVTNNNNLSSSLVGTTKRYGCHIGNSAVALGRFIPDHFLVEPGGVVNRSASTCAVASSFTYFGETVQMKDFKLTARNGLATPTATKNYTGRFARFDGSVIANFGFGAVDLADGIPPITATAVAIGGGSGELVLSSSGSWATGGDAGKGTFTANVLLNRSTTLPVGPYASFRLGVAPVDTDGVTVRAGEKNLDVSVPADAVNDKVLLGSSRIRFGRLRLQNAFGSEKLPLAVPLQAQYWTGNFFENNTDDSCTGVSVPAPVTLAGSETLATKVASLQPDISRLYFYPLVAGKNELPPQTPTVNSATLNAGRASLQFPKSDKRGWLDIILQVPPYLLGNWGNCNGQSGAAGLLDDLPCARATFGIFGAQSPLIYRRENY